MKKTGVTRAGCLTVAAALLYWLKGSNALKLLHRGCIGMNLLDSCLLHHSCEVADQTIHRLSWSPFLWHLFVSTDVSKCLHMYNFSSAKGIAGFMLPGMSA